MERERLTRLKRKGSASPPLRRRESPALQVRQPTLTIDITGDEVEHVDHGQKSTHGINSNATSQDGFPAGVLRAQETHKSTQKSVQTTSDLPARTLTGHGVQYPDGVVKKTWAFGHARAHDIKIEEVLQKQDLTSAVLSSFMWDVDWVFSKLNRDKTKVIFVMQAKDEATVRGYMHFAFGNDWLCS
jgi:hypothetical protein